MIPTFRIALIAGDGIGKEVMPEGLRVVLAAAERFGFELDCRTIDWASCDYYAQHGQMMPDDWKEQLRGVDALYFGAVGWPGTVPDHVSLWGSLLKFRREFDQYINLRPVRLFEGVPCPLAGRKPGDIDYLVVRENTEGEYTSLGGVMYEGTEREIVIQESVFSRHGTDRVLRYAYELAESRARKQLTRGHQEQRHCHQHAVVGQPRRRDRAATIPTWRSTSSTSTFCRRASCCSPRASTWWWRATCSATSCPTWGPATTGTIGLAPSANLNPDRTLSIAVRAGARLGARHLRPEHRQSDRDDLVGRVDAGLPDTKPRRAGRAAHDAIVAAIEAVLRDGPRTRDLGGTASTTEVGMAIAERVAAA
jgi:tartrate dehydrogenase/decarboxylase/D-malate dehydrogenase